MIRITIEAEDLADLAAQIFHWNEQMKALGQHLPLEVSGKPDLKIVQASGVAEPKGKKVAEKLAATEAPAERPPATYDELSELLRKIVKIGGFEGGDSALQRLQVSRLKDVSKDAYGSARETLELILGTVDPKSEAKAG